MQGLQALHQFYRHNRIIRLLTDIRKMAVDSGRCRPLEFRNFHPRKFPRNIPPKIHRNFTLQEISPNVHQVAYMLALRQAYLSNVLFNNPASSQEIIFIIPASICPTVFFSIESEKKSSFQLLFKQLYLHLSCFYLTKHFFIIAAFNNS